MTKDWRHLISEAKKLPLGKELWIGDRYTVLLHCIEKLNKVPFWQFRKRQFYNQVIERAL